MHERRGWQTARLGVVLATLAGTACGDVEATLLDGSAPVVSGTVNGKPITVAASFATQGVGPSGSYVSIVFSDNPAEVCSAFQETHAADEIATYAGSTVFSVFLLLDSATGPQPGTYAIGASGPTQFPVEVEVAVADATCQMTEIDATAGTVTLTAVSESTIRGSFDVTFGASGSLRGGFDLPDCAVTDTDAGGTYSDVCQH